ncbi:uncharacterized protein L969DRAFT_92930 [Mixia osmundae IAM 14324]|uniref:Uncharacterized protein n=1 Tax=Mixia osmundae (strain CBS 9802 / IAM 14324 / JCM 22182 / KY 12970) TaxID=764103 RepID=G7DTT2_MIXOS|nr:uncharacterized protein L969DRAFT_92930 [Mixia osmundae IAM 14324]KEI41707.1 hypothetical protein L969DRAFT_92930 [Mixia osmundae IAM 14324]GAA93992.1 hypothetical protein E5Q_00639 [Mixia osmundae IAM 14324]
MKSAMLVILGACTIVAGTQAPFATVNTWLLDDAGELASDGERYSGHTVSGELDLIIAGVKGGCGRTTQVQLSETFLHADVHCRLRCVDGRIVAPSKLADIPTSIVSLTCRKVAGLCAKHGP